MGLVLVLGVKLFSFCFFIFRFWKFGGFGRVGVFVVYGVGGFVRGVDGVFVVNFRSASTFLGYVGVSY